MYGVTVYIYKDGEKDLLRGHTIIDNVTLLMQMTR